MEEIMELQSSVDILEPDSKDWHDLLMEVVDNTNCGGC